MTVKNFCSYDLILGAKSVTTGDHAPIMFLEFFIKTL